MSTRAIQITEMRLGISQNGVPLNGGYIRFKLAGTSTLATVYQDKDKSLEADNPIQLDTQGRALVYADGILKLEIFDGDPAGSGTLLWTWDNQKYRSPNAQTSTKTANYTITPDDDMTLGDATSGALTFTLQPSANYNSPVYVKKIDASSNNVVINPDSGETIDGNTSISLTSQNETLHIFPDGSDWWSVKLTSVETAENSDTVDNIHAAATAQPNKLLALDSSSKLPASITGNADTVDSKHASDLPPVGVVLPFGGSSAPSGWFLCYGQEVSRTTYADLYGVIGTTYGVGDGSTTFNLPDCRGRVVAGQDDMGGTSANRLTGQSGGVDGDVLGGTGGVETHTLTTAQIPAHTHGTAGGHTHDVPTVGDAGSGTNGYDALNRATDTDLTTSSGGSHAHSSVGSGSAHNNVQPTLILNYIIKY